jgi:hypothetical protein
MASHEQEKKRKRGEEPNLLETARRAAAFCAMLMEAFLPANFPHTGENKFGIGTELSDIMRQIDKDREDCRKYYDGQFHFKTHQLPPWLQDCKLCVEKCTPKKAIKKFFCALCEMADILLKHGLPDGRFQAHFCLDRLCEVEYKMATFFILEELNKYYQTCNSEWRKRCERIRVQHKQARYLRPLQYGS